jgi:hypothetical protein
MNSLPLSKAGPKLFRRQNYNIVPLNQALAGSVVKLQQAIEDGVTVRPDSTRADFYELDLTESWAYIHVRDEARIVYLVAYGATADGYCGSQLLAAQSDCRIDPDGAAER